jgi:dihydropteroate synthase
MKIYKISWGAHSLELGSRTHVMGILNVTPDSFSDGGEHFSFEAAVAHGEKLAEDGADIIDIGGESTRPFSEPIPSEEEIRRVVPVIEELAKRISIPLSIDTTKAVVAKRAIEAGAAIINDIGALYLDDNMADVAVKYEVPVILMHMLGTPRTMQMSPAYDDLIGEIKTFLENAIRAAEKKGISKSKIIIDPGIGFGKTIDHNLYLIKHLCEFNALNVPVLIGPSRKSFIRNILQNKTGKGDEFDMSSTVETGTQAAIAAAALNGAHIVRVHDVAATWATLRIIDAINNETPV